MDITSGSGLPGINVLGTELSLNDLDGINGLGTKSAQEHHVHHSYLLHPKKYQSLEFVDSNWGEKP